MIEEVKQDTTKQMLTRKIIVFFNFLFPKSTLITAQQMVLLGFLPTTLYRGVIQTHDSRVAQDWNL